MPTQHLNRGRPVRNRAPETGIFLPPHLITSFLSFSRLQSPRTEGHVDAVEVDQDVNTLYYSGQAKWGTDEKEFIRIITKHGNE